MCHQRIRMTSSFRHPRRGSIQAIQLRCAHLRTRFGKSTSSARQWKTTAKKPASVLGRIAFYLALLVIVLPTGAIAQDKTPYELNAILSVTGAGAFIGSPVAEALKIVEKDVNATGGIPGRPLKIIELDDGSNPQVTLQLVSNLPKSTAVFLG